MRKMALLGAALGLVGALMAAPIAAEAGQYTVSATAPSHPTDWVQALSVAKFDTSLGNLVKVSIDYSYGLTGFVKYENLNAVAQTINLELKGKTGLRYAGGTDVNAPLNFTWSKSIDAPGRDGSFGWDGPAGGTAGTFNSTFGPVTTNLVGAAIAGYNGPGTVDFEAYSNFNSTTTSSGNVATWYDTNTSAKVDVTYIYEAVPEPGSLVAIATGLVGFAGLALKKRS